MLFLVVRESSSVSRTECDGCQSRCREVTTEYLQHCSFEAEVPVAGRYQLNWVQWFEDFFQFTGPMQNSKIAAANVSSFWCYHLLIYAVFSIRSIRFLGYTYNALLMPEPRHHFNTIEYKTSSKWTSKLKHNISVTVVSQYTWNIYLLSYINIFSVY